MKLQVKLSAILLLLCLGTSFNAEAQFFKKLKDKADKALNGNRNQNNNEATQEATSAKEHNPWHAENVGSMKFYNKFIERQRSSGDNASGLVTEHVIGGPDPLYFRAYLDKDFKEMCPTGCDMLDIRYTLAGETFTTRQLREENAPIYRRMASAISFYDAENFALGVPLVSAMGKYQQDYTLQEDAFRILLNKVKGKLTPGATLPLKIEILTENDKITQDNVLATGTINLKVTGQSNSLKGPNCRCGRPGMNDAALIKDVKEAFMFQFNDVKTVHKVIPLARSFSEFRDNSYQRNVLGKGMDANIIYEGNDGVVMNIKRFIFYKKDGNKFADKIAIGKHTYFVPVSPTCVK